MRERMDQQMNIDHLNFSLIATPAEGLSGRFVKMDKKLFGEFAMCGMLCVQILKHYDWHKF